MTDRSVEERAREAADKWLADRGWNKSTTKLSANEVLESLNSCVRSAWLAGAASERERLDNEVRATVGKSGHCESCAAASPALRREAEAAVAALSDSDSDLREFAVECYLAGHAAGLAQKDADRIGLCDHGYLKCFYCWRDAGFPGAMDR